MTIEKPTYTCNRHECKHTWKPRPKRLESGRAKPLRCPRCGHFLEWGEEESK